MPPWLEPSPEEKAGPPTYAAGAAGSLLASDGLLEGSGPCRVTPAEEKRVGKAAWR